MNTTDTMRFVPVESIMLDLDSWQKRPIFVVTGCTFERYTGERQEYLGRITLPGREDEHYQFRFTALPDRVARGVLYPVKVAVIVYDQGERRRFAGDYDFVAISFDDGRTWVHTVDF